MLPSWNKLFASALAFSGVNGAIYSGDGPTPAVITPAPATGPLETAAPSMSEGVTGASAAPTTSPIATPAHGTPGICTFVDTIIGTEKEEGQDRLSVQTKSDVPVARENMPNYVRMLTIFGNAETAFYFSPPSAVVDGTASSITVEVSALVPTAGSGSVWQLSISDSNGGNETMTSIGDFAEVGNVNWTTLYFTVPLTADSATGSLANYLNADNEMLLTVTSAEPGSTQVIFIDYMEISASCCGSFAATSLTFLQTGTCTFVDTITGVEKEEGQDRLSVQTKDDIPVAFENIANYVRMLTIFGNAQTDFHFSPPLAIVDGTAKELTVEASALVPTAGSGSVWNVSLGSNSGGIDTLTTIGNFAPAGNVNWTTVSFTMPLDDGVDVTSYVDANNEVVLTVSCSEPGSTQVLFIDFMEVTASNGTTYDHQQDGNHSTQATEMDQDADAQMDEAGAAAPTFASARFYAIVATAVLAATCAPHLVLAAL
ncbi:unnamed protein product [Scytosiphon promiscuus]